MVKDRSTAIFYSAAVCNLNCIYCSIDKNPVLKQIDQVLEESFKGDYYLNFVREIFPDPNQLKRIETWGGEPSLGWGRMHNLVDQLIINYPNFKEFFSSTNMVSNVFHKELLALLKVFGRYPEREFKFILQLSLDGPLHINDKNRGVGVTDKIIKSFDTLINTTLKGIPPNIVFETYFKPTLDCESILELQTREAIIKYYSFFENFYDKFNSIHGENPQINIFPTVPNTATPAQHTVEEGHLFANMCKLCEEIEKSESELKYFKNIMPYNGNAEQSLGSITCQGFTCGTCKYVIGLLPNDMISGCHAAFVDLLDDYKKNIKPESYQNKVLDKGVFENDSISFFCFHKSKLSQREKQIEYYYKEDTTARLISTKALIQTLAYAGQVEQKFKEDTQALAAADLIYRNASHCMKDNIGATGTITIPSVSLIKLLLNGAYDYIKRK